MMRFIIGLGMELGGNILVLVSLSDILIHIIVDTKLQLQLPDKKLQNPILPNLLANFPRPINTNTTQNSQKVNHIIQINIGAHKMWRFLRRCQRLLRIEVGVVQLGHGEGGVQLYEVYHAEF